MLFWVTVVQFVWVLVVVGYLTVNMLHLARVNPVSGPLARYPFISVCVPARNEERDIRACLESLLNQEYPQYEVIAVDDHSTDRTGEIMRSLAGKYSHLVCIEGQALPEGWLGKPFALHQAQRVARGEYLVFTDADPVFEPHALASAAHTMMTQNLDMLTLMPRAVFGSFWERTVQPMMFGFIAALTRFGKVNDPDSSRSMGFGAFLMFRREAYDAMGGHESVRGEILEDIHLGKRTKRAGFRIWVADAKRLFSIRMYHSLGEIWRGWRKNVFLAFGRSVFWTMYFSAALLAFVLTPYGVAALNLAAGAGNVSLWISLAAAFLVLISSQHLCDELELSRGYAFLFPLGALVTVGILINSMVHILGTGHSEWRGRKYSVR